LSLKISGGFDRYTHRLVDPISTSDKAFLRVSVSQSHKGLTHSSTAAFISPF
jgi:hypothetical protein